MRQQDEYSTPNDQSPAEKVWSLFSGLFGADALKRKYGMKPPPEWDSALAHLTDAQLRRGVDTVMLSGSEHIPSLPQFIASCRSAREWTDNGSIKISAPITDKWGIAANQHLLARVLKYPQRYAPDSTYNPATRQAEPGPLTRAYTEIVVAWKNAWADDMRADDKGEGISVEQQRVAWEDCMERADQQIAQLSQEKAA